jgi:hypothetical protein
MSNFTSSNRVPSLHGGQPYTSRHTEATLPQSPRAGSGDRLPGSIYSRRAKSPEHLPTETLRRIKASQVLAGVRDPEVAQSQAQEPPPVISAGSRAAPGWGEWIGSWFSKTQSPEATEAVSETPPEMHPDSGRDGRPVRAGVVTVKIDLPPIFPENSAKNEKVWVKVLKNFFGANSVHVLDWPPGTTPYIRNVATTTPDGTLVTSEIRGRDSLLRKQDQARDVLEEYFLGLGLPVKRLPSQTNFANVEYVESRDALILAHSDIAVIRDTGALEEVFGRPKYVLQVWLDLTKKHGAESRCYDLDLAFHVTMNADGRPVALLHTDCLKSDRNLPSNILTASKFRQELIQLGFEVVDISKEEQLALATQGISNPDMPGKLLFTRDQMPPSLVEELAEVGVEVIAPNSKRLIGYNGQDFPMFGLHCLTMNMRIPIEEEEPKDSL